MKHWMQTATGKAIDLENPVICFDDIALSLSKMCRYGGHTKGFTHYSVAEHCVLMSRHKEWDKNSYTKKQRWNLLMHDAREAIMVDMISPWKALLPEYRVHEQRIAEAIAKQYDLEYPDPDYVKELDMRILLDERDQVMMPAPADWGLPPDLHPLKVAIKGYAPDMAYKHFWKAAKEFAHVPLD
jgi:hypothetical protein